MFENSRNLLSVMSLACGVGVWSAPLHAQDTPALPLNQTVRGQMPAEGFRAYTFTAPQPGALAVLVRIPQDATLAITDEYGQDLLDGLGDMDWNGQAGAEQTLLPLKAGQTVTVEVSSWSEAAGPYRLVASFVPTDEDFSAPVHPQSTPAGAVVLQPGKVLESNFVADSGHIRSWFKFTPEQDGTVTFTTRQRAATGAIAMLAQAAGLADEPDQVDLFVEAYAGDDYRNALAYSDEDLSNDMAGEMVMVPVIAGQPVFFRVGLYYGSSVYTVQLQFDAGEVATPNPNTPAEHRRAPR